MRRRRPMLSDVLVSAGALALLLAVLMAFDGRVREQVRLRFEGPARASADIAAVTTQARDMVDVLLESVQVQSRQHGPLLIMLAAGTVLTVFMLRT